MSEPVSSLQHFANYAYLIKKPEFLDAVKPVAIKELNKLKVVDKFYPIIQTESLSDPAMQDFANYTSQIAWLVLRDQGYDMDRFNTIMNELWAQQLNTHGQHYEHVHGMGAQISGFYFLDVPKKSSKPILHDPNHAKRQINLPQADESKITPASIAVNYEVEPGDLFLFNSWLPHSFIPNASSKPFRFLHFNITVVPANSCEIPPAAEII